MVRIAQKEDIPALARLALCLWENHTLCDLEEEFSRILSRGNACFFLKYHQEQPVGFAQCQLRTDYVEGTHSSPVGYLEGIYVAKEFRGRGYARELLSHCESWARSQGCREFASDCSLDNQESFLFHQTLHFQEAGRIICFTKTL